jgi:hypothetical protein
MAWMMTESSTRKQATYPVIRCENALSRSESYSVLREPVLVCVPIEFVPIEFVVCVPIEFD